MKTCPLCEKAYPSNHTSCPTDGALLVDLRELEPGTVIRGKYRIVRMLGRGGMGTVYLAEHILLGRQRALKFISSELSQDAAFLRRFRREAQAAIDLQHPNVVQVVDLDQAEDGSPYIAMEYVEGPDLRHALAAGVFPVERALIIARGIAQGLGAAHAKGIVHRDVKPENILFAGGNGTLEMPKLLDFGIAATKESSTAYTRTGGTLLTMAYAAPEQWRGTPAASLDGRTDLYALGGLLYEMLTGQTPFHAENYEGWSRQHQTTPPQPPSALRPDLANWQGLDALLLRLLAKDRNDRPKDVAELINLLDVVRLVSSEARRDTAIDEPGASLGQKTAGVSDKTARRWGIWIGLLAGGLILAALAVWFSSHLSKKPTLAEIEDQAYTLYEQKRFAESAPLFDQACAGGNIGYCHWLGTMYEDGKGVEKDYSRAARLYDKGCDSDNSGSCFKLGDFYHDGKGVAKDYSQAVTLYDKTCKSGTYAESCYALALMYLKGEGVVIDYSRVVAYDIKACDEGYSLGCYGAGSMYKQGRFIKKDDSRAAELFSKSLAIDSKACDGGNGDICFQVGNWYAVGDLIAKDIGKARQFYRKGCSMGSKLSCDDLKKLDANEPKPTQVVNPKNPAQQPDLAKIEQQATALLSQGRDSEAAPLFDQACNGGYPKACRELGYLYANGYGVEIDLHRAVTLFSKACEGGYANGCAALGYRYETGDGVEKDESRAASLYLKACNEGDIGGCNILGNSYLDGIGVRKDTPRAAFYFSKACDAGDSGACGVLGDMYEKGNGVEKDSSRARAYFSKACELGLEMSCGKAEKLH